MLIPETQAAVANGLIKRKERTQSIEAIQAVYSQKHSEISYENRCTEGDIRG